MKFIIFILIYLFIICYSHPLIWIIRHCDKSYKYMNYCCSTEGYYRAIKWGEYFSDKIPYNQSIKIYTSNFKKTKSCFLNMNYNTDNSCQKSQRMLLTSNLIYNVIYNKLNHKIDNDINYKYCIKSGYKKMFNIIKNNQTNDNIIVVWQHDEIISAISDIFEQKYISNWTHDLKLLYNVVFILKFNYSINKYQLFYDCLYKHCDRKIIKWLSLGTKWNVKNNIIIKEYIYIIIFISLFIFIFLYTTIYCIDYKFRIRNINIYNKSYHYRTI